MQVSLSDLQTMKRDKTGSQLNLSVVHKFVLTNDSLYLTSLTYLYT